MSRFLRSLLLAGLALGIGGWATWVWWGQAKPALSPAAASEGMVEPPLARDVNVATVEPVYSPLADELHAARFDAAHDLVVLRGLLGQFTTTLRLSERPPLGDNADITAALAGKNRRLVVFIPPTHPALRSGVLVDRTGVPYHFHARSADVIDVRSAGPDRVFFTADDLVSP